ncbi:MerR family transcriptional regulator (plasmid) [Rhodococcus globerulus]|uniref:MerR family transcriptional regulator n=1 Tax=Rhodococcus globerulus TaxID=33008 RepID=UPI0039EB097F
MNSAELAKRAGVSVRALRHYPKIGVLAEPPRLTNGYRQYGYHDLVHVLRIKRLSALGIPLSGMAELVAEGTGEDLLDELDRELETAIIGLNHQRHLISRVRSQRIVSHDACAQPGLVCDCNGCTGHSRDD